MGDDIAIAIERYKAELVICLVPRTLENIPIRCIGEFCVGIVSDTSLKRNLDRIAGYVFLLFLRILRARCGQDQRKAADDKKTLFHSLCH